MNDFNFNLTKDTLNAVIQAIVCYGDFEKVGTVGSWINLYTIESIFECYDKQKYVELLKQLKNDTNSPVYDSDLDRNKIKVCIECNPKELYKDNMKKYWQYCMRAIVLSRNPSDTINDIDDIDIFVRNFVYEILLN